MHNFLWLALNPIALKIGDLDIRWYGVIITGAIFIALWLSLKEAKLVRIDQNHIYNILLYALPVALVCARIYYVVFQWSYYQQNPGQIIAIWHGGIAIYGGLIGALLVVIWYTKKNKIPLMLFLDVLSPTVLMAQGIGRWGNFMNQEAFGKITTLHFLNSLHLPHFIISQMYINGYYRVPTFLYESVWDLLGFIILISTRHIKKLYLRGEITLGYLSWYSFGRFFIEGMRTDSLMLGSIRISQLLSAIIFFVSIVLIIIRRHKKEPLYLSGV